MKLTDTLKDQGVTTFHGQPSLPFRALVRFQKICNTV